MAGAKPSWYRTLWQTMYSPAPIMVVFSRAAWLLLPKDENNTGAKKTIALTPGPKCISSQLKDNSIDLWSPSCNASELSIRNLPAVMPKPAVH